MVGAGTTMLPLGWPGFYAELAAGGLSRPASFKSTLEQLHGLLEPRHGIWLNMLYLNAKQWGFQFPLALKLRRQGGCPVPFRTQGVCHQQGKEWTCPLTPSRCGRALLWGTGNPLENRHADREYHNRSRRALSGQGR
jgi:hypothetical protein